MANESSPVALFVVCSVGCPGAGARLDQLQTFKFSQGKGECGEAQRERESLFLNPLPEVKCTVIKHRVK